MNELHIQLKGEDNRDPRAVVNSFKERKLNVNRAGDRGIINEKTGAMILARENGTVGLINGETSSVKVNPDKIIQVAPETVTITNRQHVLADEVMINHHKLNPQLVELSDTRVLFDNPKDAIGNLMLDGTVLVKAWEENMGRYVLIRRKIRTPMFSSKVNAPLVPEAMGLSTDYIERLDVNSAILLKEDKDKKDKITAEMLDAQGGSNYDQGDYNNYEDSFVQSGNSITQQGGYEGGYTDTTETFEDPLKTPTSVTVNHVSTSNTKKRPNKALKLEYITIHSTGNANSSASQERRYLDNPENNREASWHLCIDEHECIEAIPLNEVAWHAGSGNDCSIGIEICESGNREKTLEKAAQLTGSLLKERGWGIDKLKRHNDWTGKNCPRIFNEDDKWTGWESFKKRVQRYL